MARRLGIYTLGHYLSLKGAVQKDIWNPLLQGFEKWELSVLDTANEEDRGNLDESLVGMQLTYNQVLNGYFPIDERIACLERIHEEFTKNFENLASIMSMEVQKPIQLAKAECERSLDTIQATIDWGKRLLLEAPVRKGQGRGAFEGSSEAWPRGIVLGVTPFNFPYNLSLHKIAPAILAGCPLIWRPSPKCQLSNLALVDVLHAAKLPAGMLAFLPMTHESFWRLLADPRISCVSFTGSEAVGWEIRQKYRGPCVLELGGSAPIYVEKIGGDILQKAVKEIIASAFSFGGQSCISAQSLLVQEDLWAEAWPLAQRELENFAVGQVQDIAALSAGVIDKAAAERIEKTLEEAVNNGAKIFRSSKKVQIQNFVAPTLVLNGTEKILKNEIFAPVLNVLKVKGLPDFLEFANSLPHRLQAAIYSHDEKALHKARLELDFGGVALNCASSVRVDSLPYGGRALAGVGVEDPQSTWGFLAPLKTFYTPKF